MIIIIFIIVKIISVPSSNTPFAVFGVQFGTWCTLSGLLTLQHQLPAKKQFH